MLTQMSRFADLFLQYFRQQQIIEEKKNVLFKLPPNVIVILTQRKQNIN